MAKTAKTTEAKELTISSAALELEQLREKLEGFQDKMRELQGREMTLQAWLTKRLLRHMPQAGAPRAASASGGEPRGAKTMAILGYIKAHPGCKVPAMAEALGMKKNNLGVAVNNLKLAGKVKSLLENGKEPGKDERGGYLHAV